VYLGREEFVRRREEIFGGYPKGTTASLVTRYRRFVRPDVAVVDVDVSLVGVKAPPGRC
jgi:hypothetical protein